MNAAAFRSGVPMTVIVELTRRCNLNCDHCYVDHHIKHELSVAQLDTIFADIARAGGLMLTFTGGEIGLRKDLVDIVKAARKYHFNIKLNSTATLFTDADIETLAALQVRYVNVSVYSDKAEVHDAVVQHKGAFDRTVHAIEKMRAAGIKVVLQCPLMTSNKNEISSIIALAERLDCTSTFDPVVAPMEDGRTDPCVLRLSAGEIANVYAAGGVIEFMSDGGGAGILPPREPGDKLCSAGHTLAFIDSRGDVYPCVAWRERVGNALSESFYDLWRDSPHFARMRAITAGALSECGGCSNEKYCSYCPGLAHAERQDPTLAPPSACNAAEGKRLFFEELAHGHAISDPGFFGHGRFAEGHAPIAKKARLPIIHG